MPGGVHQSQSITADKDGTKETTRYKRDLLSDLPKRSALNELNVLELASPLIKNAAKMAEHSSEQGPRVWVVVFSRRDSEEFGVQRGKSPFNCTQTGVCSSAWWSTFQKMSNFLHFLSRQKPPRCHAIQIDPL
jgi:hypothetical protein